MSKTKIEEVIELWPDEEFMVADGYDEAIIGVEEEGMRIVYDVDQIIRILMKDGMTADDAYDFYHYNIVGSYVGEKTPLFVTLIKN